jgi:NCS1 family nucleobase:cation symporter-1
MLVSPVVNPWRLVNTATTFLTVLSSYSVFLGPMTGMMVASYLVVNRQKINVDDLFHGGSSSIYWYTAGVNWRAPIAVSPTHMHFALFDRVTHIDSGGYCSG